MILTTSFPRDSNSHVDVTHITAPCLLVNSTSERWLTKGKNPAFCSQSTAIHDHGFQFPKYREQWIYMSSHAQNVWNLFRWFGGSSGRTVACYPHVKSNPTGGNENLNDLDLLSVYPNRILYGSEALTLSNTGSVILSHHCPSSVSLTCIPNPFHKVCFHKPGAEFTSLSFLPFIPPVIW